MKKKGCLSGKAFLKTNHNLCIINQLSFTKKQKSGALGLKIFEIMIVF
ncbi:MAG: hypothetical protein RLZZ417_1819 [Bacteroidota bacterium]|jgi:hypothetical protein